MVSLPATHPSSWCCVVSTEYDSHNAGLFANSSRLLPIAAIITPAAINVVTKDNILTTQGNPPQLFFDSKYYANIQTLINKIYFDPSPATLRTAFGSAMTGQIQAITHESPNMTYTLDFLGPTLRCDPADAAFVSGLNESYMDEFGTHGDIYNYAAWVPAKDIGSSNLSSVIGSTMPTLDVVSTDAAHIYIIPNTTMMGPYFAGGQQMSYNARYGYQDALDCKLYNATYRAFFNFTFPNQIITVQSKEFLNPVNVSTRQWSGAANYTMFQNEQRLSYQSIMDSFGRLMVGWDHVRDGGTTTKGSWNMMAIDWKTRESSQWGIEQLFQNITLSMLSTPSLT
jgi:hypothetical protein